MRLLEYQAPGGIVIQNEEKKKKKIKHTTAGIRWWSPTQLLTGRRVA